MAKTETIRARMEPDVKERAESVFHTLGLTATEAITLFYVQVGLRNGLPFDVAIPNEETLQVFRDTDAGRDVVECRDADEIFKRLDL